MVEIELNQISRKYESYRLKNEYIERRLLSSIVEKGIQEPLLCTFTETEQYILLDGYKRLRCLSRLNIHIVPVHSLGSNEQDGIIELIRDSNNKSLQTLEQSGFVDELHKSFGMTVSDIAEKLEVSPSWVSLRLGLIEEMSETVRMNIFSDKFPVRSYMYSLKPFTRVKKNKDLVDRFVSSVSGKHLSTRDMDRLIYGYFRGGERFRKQIEEGNIDWTLKVLKDSTASLSQEIDLKSEERRIINDLEILQKYMVKVIQHFSGVVSSRLPGVHGRAGSLLPTSPRMHGRAGSLLPTSPFKKNASLLIKGILDSIKPLRKQIGEFYDQ
ncbi:MAG: ParB N-terminal domain-containing protein [Spirochaetia bacterium]|jgi:ParB/RepB/Spo0J family partition protein|nr:ParB N-terminal domain-containing protein [Spirochaetia bacterium]